MKRKALIKQIRKIARAKKIEVEFVEGGKHTKVRIAGKTVTISSRGDTNEITAKVALKAIEEYETPTEETE